MDTWDQLQFLIGTWSSPVSGQPGEGVAGSSTFSYQLGEKIITRTSRAEFAPEPGEREGNVHEDLLIIYPQPGDPPLRAMYFDNEGHIIHYTLSFPPEQPGVVFDNDASAPGPRARLVYEQTADGTLKVEFFVAAPGGELLSHVNGTLKRSEE